MRNRLCVPPDTGVRGSGSLTLLNALEDSCANQNEVTWLAHPGIGVEEVN